MLGMISTDNFRRFYMHMSVETPQIVDYFEVMKKAFLEIEGALCLGKCIMIVNSPATSIELEGMQDRSIIYEDPNGINEDAGIRQTFVTADWGVVQIELYPKVGCEWKDEDDDELEFLVQVVFDCISKERNAIIMKRATVTDSLTGACNAMGLINYATELKEENRLGDYDGVCFNIKNFNYINQRVGSKEGDKVLKTFSGMVREFLIKGEIFARTASDTFAVVIEKARTEDFIKYITTRRVRVELPNKSMEFDLMIRLGVYDTQPTDSVSRVIAASQAAYRYTRNPSAGDIVRFSEDMMTESEHDKEISESFTEALKNKEFMVYYQPKVSLTTSNLVSAEALCRWIRKGSLVPPMEFIPQLEREGTICDLDFFMLNSVCEHITEWENRGIEPVKISVNFSKIHMFDKRLAEKIVKLIDSHRVDHKYIEIEIMEMSGFEDFDTLSEFVDTMKSYGIETSIDDFGTGYTSINMIKDLNVDTIKLDKSFLQKISIEEDTDRNVVRNIIDMVNTLNMKVVAEGIETDYQREFLKKVNCHVGQGFLFDKPMPKEQFEIRLLGKRMY